MYNILKGRWIELYVQPVKWHYKDQQVIHKLKIHIVQLHSIYVCMHCIWCLLQTTDMELITYCADAEA